MIGKFAVMGPTHIKLQNCMFRNEFDTLNTNMKVSFDTNIYFKKKHFCVALKYNSLTEAHLDLRLHFQTWKVVPPVSKFCVCTGPAARVNYKWSTNRTLI